jgi:molybdopterin biosynthesis enzyme
LVKTFLNELMGFRCKPFVVPFPIAADYSRKNDNRTAFLPVNINKQGEAEMIEYHGSAHINGFDQAWGLMEIPLGVKKISKGEKVNVRQI